MRPRIDLDPDVALEARQLAKLIRRTHRALSAEDRHRRHLLEQKRAKRYQAWCLEQEREVTNVVA